MCKCVGMTLSLSGCVNVNRHVCVCVWFFFSLRGLLLVKETRSAESGPMA